LSSLVPDLRLPSLDALRAFESAARLGTFERAADELNVTASAVGKRISALEDLLGVALFQRGAKALALSAAGKEYLEQVRAALALLAAVPLHRRSAQSRLRLRVSAPPTFARQILVPALPGFTDAHPEIELEVVLSIPFLEGPAQDPDVDVRHGPAGAAGDAVLMRDVLLPLASPALLAEQPALRHPEDLARLPLLRTPVEPWAPWFQAQRLDWPEPDTGPRLVDLGLTLEAAICGQGVALARPSLARPYLRSGQLRPVFGPGQTPTATPATAYYLMPLAGTSPAAAQFAQWLRGACERAAAEGLALISGPA
jgi:DNA-binding transcriptional LysR family regulator